MKNRFVGIIAIIVLALTGLIGCSKNDIGETVETTVSDVEISNNTSDEDVTTNIIDDKKNEENSASTDVITETETEEVESEEIETEELPTAENEPKQLTKSGIYTFYNETLKSYLSFEGNTLVLSETSTNWNLNRVNESKFHIYADETELVLDIDNAYVAEGTTVKLWQLTGYDVQLWNINKNENDTYTIAYSGNNQYCLGFDAGNAVLQLRDKQNLMQEWKLVDVSDSIPARYLSYESKGGIVQLQLPLDILSVVSETRLEQWADELETAYYTFGELTNYVPFDHIVVEAYKPGKYAGWVTNKSNIIHIDKEFIYGDLEKMNARDCDWNFCALHEMGHMFDFDKPWNFETELMTDLKVAYVLEKNGVAAAPAEFEASEYFYGADIIKAYERLGKDFSKEYDIYGCTKRFLDIKEDIGWEPFEKTFRYLQENEAVYVGSSKQQKFEKFVELLSGYGNKDVKSYFSEEEWNVIINKTNS